MSGLKKPYVVLALVLHGEGAAVREGDAGAAVLDVDGGGDVEGLVKHQEKAL